MSSPPFLQIDDIDEFVGFGGICRFVDGDVDAGRFRDADDGADDDSGDIFHQFISNAENKKGLGLQHHAVRIERIFIPSVNISSWTVT